MKEHIQATKEQQKKIKDQVKKVLRDESEP